MAESHYVHGTDAAEQARLAKLNQLLNRRSLAAMDLRGGERMLDVGSGLGQLSLAMLSAAGPQARLLGIERSDEQRRRAIELASAGEWGDRAEFRAGNALSLNLHEDEWGSFDLVHTRFLLEHVPDPLAVVRQMVRAARPGGRIVLEDDDHELLRLWPRCPEIESLWQVYQAGYRARGNDPIVGRRLIELLHHAGATPRKNDWLFFGSCSGHEDFVAYVQNLHGVLEGAGEQLRSDGGLGPRELEAALAALQQWAKRPDAALWYCTAWAEGVKPAPTSP